MQLLSRARKRRLAALLLALPLLAVSAVAVADQSGVDNDLVASGNQNVVTLTAAPGATVATSGRVVVEHSGNRHVPAGTTVNFAVVAGQTTLPAGYSVASTSVTIPSPWSGGKAGSAPAAVEFTAPASPGNYTYTVKWEPTGSGCWNDNPSCLTGGAALTVNLTVQQANAAPGAPGKPAGPSLDADGQFTLNWTAATDPNGDPVTYVLEHRDADDAAFSQVASGIASTSYTFGSGSPEAEGTWTYRVKAVDSHGAAGGYSQVSDQVKVDRSAPNAPTLSIAAAADYTDGDGNDWYKDTVSVGVADNGDPALADGSAGSGVDSSSLSSPFTVSTNGASTHTRRVTDNAGHQSAAASITVHVDAADPSVSISGCPTGPVPIESSRSVDVTAADSESGLAAGGDPSGTVALHTGTIGAKTASFTARDNVGHEKQASCSYTVVYDWMGFFRPVEAMPTLNALKAGSAVPVKFSLDGVPDPGSDASQGPAVLETGYPKSQEIACSSTAPVDGVEETLNAGGSSLTYDAAADQYVYTWKTDKAWAGKCRQLVVKLADGSIQRANFKLTK